MADADHEVLASRPDVRRPDGSRVGGAFVEMELARSGRPEPVATVLFANHECPFRCVYCDLWRGTTVDPLPPGQVVRQLDQALAALPPARHLKLYNSGSFFDPLAIRPEDLAPIAQRVAAFETLIVESHPAFVGRKVAAFRQGLRAHLEVAIGLETAHPEALARLNKRMTVDDFERAARFLRAEGIFVRTFVLVDPPFVPPGEQLDWAVRSAETAFAAGSDVVVFIPLRDGNGYLDELRRRGEFTPAPLALLAQAAERALALGGGRVLVDLWDIERLAGPRDFPALKARLEALNREQRRGPTRSRPQTE